MEKGNVLWLFDKYPSIALGLKRDGKDQTPEQGFKHLCMLEPRTITRVGWSAGDIKKYSSFITFNRAFCIENNIMNMSYILYGCFGITLQGHLNSFTSYDEKIKGVVLLGKKGHRAYEDCGNIYYLREEFLNKFPIEPKLCKHVYSESVWEHEYFQGICGGKPWGPSALCLVDRYLYCFCPENTYHPLWSWGYFTERIFRCFRAKTVALYIGAYNIEDYIPSDLFIDLREFYVNGKMNWRDLSLFLDSFSEEKYIKMVEEAYEWEKTTSFCSSDSMENLFKELHRRTTWDQEWTCSANKKQ